MYSVVLEDVITSLDLVLTNTLNRSPPPGENSAPPANKVKLNTHNNVLNILNFASRIFLKNFNLPRKKQ